MLAAEGDLVRLAEFEVRLDSDTLEEAARIVEAVARARFTPPSGAELGADAEVLGMLVASGRLVRVREGVYYEPGICASMTQSVLEWIDSHGSPTVAQVRDMFGMSRKYALAILEYMDSARMTRRVGDERVRR